MRTLVRRRPPMGGLELLRQQFLDGDDRAMRALVRQVCGPNTLDMPFQETEIRVKSDGTGGDRLLFTGYASVVEAPFTMTDWLGDYTEVMRAGSFTKTLSQSPDVIFCLNHGWDGVPMARTKAGTLRLSADSTGLHNEADLDPSRSDVHMVRSAMDAGELDAQSFAFYVTRQTWSPDYDQRDILEVDMDGGDTSVVTWPANPATTGTTALRSVAATSLVRAGIPRLLSERVASEKRAGAKISAATMETLQAVYDLVLDANDSAGAAAPLLAALMGVEETNQTTDEPVSPESHDDAPTAGMSLARMRLREAALSA